MRRSIALLPLLVWGCSTAPLADPPPPPSGAATEAPSGGAPAIAYSYGAASAAVSAAAVMPNPTAAPTVAASASASASASGIPASPVLPPPLPKDTVVLHVGDSMADALGKDLRRELEKRGIDNPLKYKEATYIPQWAGYKMGLASHLARYKPDLVIVTLGGNETAMPDPTVRADPVRRIVKMIGDTPCLWVAAPLWPGAPNTGILKVVRDNCAPCIYVDTNTLMTKMKVLGDGVHPTLKERKRWAKFMVRWLLQNRDPNGVRSWDFKQPTTPPPAGSVAWLSVR